MISYGLILTYNKGGTEFTVGEGRQYEIPGTVSIYYSGVAAT